MYSLQFCEISGAPDDIHPRLLPASKRSAKAGRPLASYFNSPPIQFPGNLFRDWANYYTSNPKRALSDLLTTLVFIAGSSVQILLPHLRHGPHGEIQIILHDDLEIPPADSPIALYFQTPDTRAFSFWIGLSHGATNNRTNPTDLLVPIFEILQEWLFSFCDSALLPLRQTAVVAVVAFYSFFVSDLRRVADEPSRLASLARKPRDWKMRIDLLDSVVESWRVLSMRLLNVIIRHRLHDTDPSISEFCLKAIETGGQMESTDTGGQMESTDTRDQMESTETGSQTILDSIASAVNDESATIRREGYRLVRLVLQETNLLDSAPVLTTLAEALTHKCHEFAGWDLIPALELMTLMVVRGLMDCPSVESVFHVTRWTTADALAAAWAVAELAIAQTPKPIGEAVPRRDAHQGSVEQLAFQPEPREILSIGADGGRMGRSSFPDVSFSPAE
jgi:hypothetical protein